MKSDRYLQALVCGLSNIVDIYDNRRIIWDLWMSSVLWVVGSGYEKYI